MDGETGQITTSGKAGGIAATLLDGTIWQLLYEGSVMRVDLLPAERDRAEDATVSQPSR